jgi:hypothetical protein
MPPLGALTQAWTAAEAALPLGWQISGLYRFDELRVAPVAWSGCHTQSI